MPISREPSSSRDRTRILFISRAYEQHAGGMERLSFELLEQMRKRPDFLVRTLVYQTAQASLFWVRIRSLLFLLRIAPRALLAARNVDVVHLGDPVLSKLGWFIRKLYRIPILVTVHGLDVQYANPLYRLYLSLFFRHLDGYIPISTFASRCLARWRVTGQVQVIHPGINDRYFDGTIVRSQLEKLLNRDLTSTTVLVTVGRLVERKGHAWFIEHVLPKLPTNVLYVMAGDGPQRRRIEEVIAKTKAESKVSLLGKVDEDDLRVLYNTADAFIQPNIQRRGDIEGFGLAMLEAASCKRVVLAANVDGIPSAIHDGKNGELLPPANAEAWIAAIKASAFPGAKNVAARDYTLRTFAWPRIAEQYAEFFRSHAP